MSTAANLSEVVSRPENWRAGWGIDPSRPAIELANGVGIDPTRLARDLAGGGRSNFPDAQVTLATSELGLEQYGRNRFNL